MISNVSSIPFCLLLLFLPLLALYPLLMSSCLTVPGHSALDFVVVVQSFFSLVFSCGHFCWAILKLRDSLLSPVQSLVKGILHFCQCFWSLTFLFGSFLEFPSLCSQCPSVLTCCLLCPAYVNRSGFKFLPGLMIPTSLPLSASGSNACSVSSICVFHLSLCLVIFFW